MNDQSFGQTVREFRQIRGYTQETLAETLGISQELVSLWERDRRTPSTPKLLALAGILRISPSMLLEALMRDRDPEPDGAQVA